MHFRASPAVFGDRVIFAGQDGVVRCWRRPTAASCGSSGRAARLNSSPVIAGDRVFFGSNDGTLYALKVADGAKVWSFRTGAPGASSPAVGEGRLVIAAATGRSMLRPRSSQLRCFRLRSSIFTRTAADNSYGGQVGGEKRRQAAG